VSEEEEQEEVGRGGTKKWKRRKEARSPLLQQLAQQLALSLFLIRVERLGGRPRGIPGERAVHRRRRKGELRARASE